MNHVFNSFLFVCLVAVIIYNCLILLIVITDIIGVFVFIFRDKSKVGSFNIKVIMW